MDPDEHLNVPMRKRCLCMKHVDQYSGTVFKATIGHPLHTLIRISASGVIALIVYTYIYLLYAYTVPIPIINGHGLKRMFRGFRRDGDHVLVYTYI